MTDRFHVLRVPTSELQAWYDCEWTFSEADEVPGFSIIKWEHATPPRQPFPALTSEAVEDAA